MLSAFQSLAPLGEVRRLDGGSVGIVCILQDTNVDSDDSFWILWLFGSVFVHVDTERGEPLARGLSLDRDLFDDRVLGNVSVEVNRNLADFAQPQYGPTTRILEFETGLIVGERPILPGRLPFEHPYGTPVFFLSFERRKVVVDALDDHLQHLRVDVVQVAPPRLEVGECPLYVMPCWNLICLIDSVEDVVVESPTSIDVA